MAHKIEAPAGYAVHGPWRYPETNPPDLYWIHGVTYIDLDAMPHMRTVLDGMKRRGYTITPGQDVPADYEQAIVLLRQDVQRNGYRPNVALQDVLDRARTNYPTTAPYEGANSQLNPAGLP